MAIGELEQRLPVAHAHHAPRRVIRRANVKQLGPRPYGHRHFVPARRIGVCGEAVDAIRHRTGEQRRAFVDLIERVRHDDGCADSARVDDGLREREQRFAAAQHRQHLRVRIECAQRVAANEPRGDGLAQAGRACGCGIIRETFGAGRQRFQNQRWRRMLGLAQRKIDRPACRVRRDSRKKRSQTLERIRLQPRELRVQR